MILYSIAEFYSTFVHVNKFNFVVVQEKKKVPKEEQKFLLDQRQERKMRFGGIDRILSTKGTDKQ